MKISRFGLLLAWASCAPWAGIGLLQAADESPAAAAARPIVHNVLRDGPSATSKTVTAAAEKQSAEPAGPSLLGPKSAEVKPAVTKEVAAKPTAPTIVPADEGAAIRNTLRDGTTLGTTSTPKPIVSTSPATTPTPIETPVRAVKAPPGGGTAVISDKPAAPSADERRPNALLNPDGEETGKKAEIAKRPVGDESKKLFESPADVKPLTPELELLRKRVQSTLATFYHNWTLNTRDHCPWEIMHAIIAYGVDTRLLNNGQTTTAIGHLCFSGVCNKQSIVSLRDNQLYVHRGIGVQGHSGQFLAILAQSHLQRDYPLYVGGREFSLEDLIRAEQHDCESGTELTFKLIGLMHYLPSDATWTNFQGQTWNIDRLVREEIVQPVRGAACGGTHRLMGLSYAVRKREQRDQPVDGIYREAEKYIDQYHKYTFGLQNSDGSFSTAWFVRREARLDLDRRLQTTGHILEWLCFSLSDEQLRDPRVVRAVKYVTDLLLVEKDHAWEIGHLGHALHALQLYNERVFGGPVRSYEGLVLRRSVKTAQRTDGGSTDDTRSSTSLR